MKINANSNVDELVGLFPGIAGFLGDKGIRCIVCGEPVWGTIGEMAKDKGFTPEQIVNLVEELNSKFKNSD